MKFGWTLESLPMVIELVDQVLALHPDIEWFHIGGDEVMCLRNEATQVKMRFSFNVV